MAGLSLEASAVISVMPAARASAISSAASAEPMPWCWYESATAKAISALSSVVAGEARDRDRLRVALDVGDERVMGAVDGGELLELGGASGTASGR